MLNLDNNLKMAIAGRHVVTLLAVLLTVVTVVCSAAGNQSSISDDEPAPYIPPGGHECTGHVRSCQNGVLLPVWRPVHNISMADKAGRAFVYLLALCYLFLGVSIIADRFMASIEVITSNEREVTVLR